MKSRIFNASKISDKTLRPGTLLNNRYQIEKIIGTGGMSVVYEALDLSFNSTKHAVKEMFDLLTDPLVRERARESFEREGNLLMSLNKLKNQHLPQVYDLFEENGRHYMVYELIDGQDLGHYLHQRARPISPAKVVDWAIQLTEVLAVLHERNPPIIFRDLKPSNVMLKPDGKIVLIDFGIAKNFKIEKGTIIGTEGYAPPEQYEGQADIRVDIYALGATMHHLLTNTDPQNSAPFSYYKRPIKKYNSAVPDELARIVMRAVSQNPEDRWQNVFEFREALKTVEDILKLPQEKKTGGFTGLLKRLREREQSNTEEINRGSQEQRQAQETLDDRTEPVAFVSQPKTINNATQPVGANPSVQGYNAKESSPLPGSGTIGFDEKPSIQVAPLWSFKAEDEIRSTPCLTEESVYIGSYDSNLYCLNRATGELRWKFPTQRGIASTPTIADKLVIIGSDDGQVYALNKQSGQLEWTKQTGAPVRSSPHIYQKHLFIGSDDSHLYALNMNTGVEKWKVNLVAPIRSTAVSDNNLIVIGTEEGLITGINAETGQTSWRVSTERSVISRPVVAGKNVIVGSLDRQVYCIQLHSGWPVWRRRLSEAIYSSLALHDEKLYVFTVDGTLYCLELDEGREIWKSQIKTIVTSSPFITQQGMLYVGGKNGVFYCLETKKGNIVWNFQTGGPIPGSPRVWEAEGVVYFGSMDHHLYALRIPK